MIRYLLPHDLVVHYRDDEAPRYTSPEGAQDLITMLFRQLKRHEQEHTLRVLRTDDTEAMPHR